MHVSGWDAPGWARIRGCSHSPGPVGRSWQGGGGGGGGGVGLSVVIPVLEFPMWRLPPWCLHTCK